MTNQSLTIIIVTFNSAMQIQRCISSIVNSSLSHLKINIIIIDNNSIDTTVLLIKKLQEKIDTITLIKNKENVGFAKAVNQGIIKSRNCDYILLLNPDTELEKYSIRNLLICSTKYGAGICGGTTYNNQGKLTGSYFRFPNLMVEIFDFTNFRKLIKNDKWHKYFYYLDKKIIKPSFPVNVVTGGFMLINRSTLNLVGLFDESFFMYLEDVDYCLRAAKYGIKIYHTNTSKIMHIGGASSNNKDRIRHNSWLISRKIYSLKHFGIVKNLIIQPIFLLDDLIILLKKTIYK